jgi:PPM family protein phosphatase
MSFITAGCTQKGGRAKNEDAICDCQREDAFVAVVADGLGMHGGGDIASETAAKVLSQRFFENTSLDKSIITGFFEQANDAIVKKQTAAEKMKSTAVALFSLGKKYAVAHIGDSRLYQFSSGKIVYQTIDHSVSQMAVFSGEIDASQIRFHEDRNRVLRALGSEDGARPDIYLSELPVTERDAFLLCTDGFWEYVLEPEMEVDLNKSSTPKQWLSYLTERIGKRVDGKNDNMSALAIFFKEDGNQK